MGYFRHWRLQISQLWVPSVEDGENVYTVCFMKNIDQLLVGYDDKVRLYDVHTGSSLLRMIVATIFIHRFFDKTVTCSRNGLLQEWDDTLTEIRRYNLGFKVNCACIGHIDDTIAAAAGDYIAAVDLAVLTSKKMFAGIANPWCLQFSVDGSKIVAGLYNSTKNFILDVVNETVLYEFDSYGVACFSFDSKSIYVRSSQHSSITALHVETHSWDALSFQYDSYLG
jgi:hypothetical protein